MEFGLLQLLVERRRTVTDAELAYVAWHEIADALAFRSVQATARTCASSSIAFAASSAPSRPKT